MRRLLFTLLLGLISQSVAYANDVAVCDPTDLLVPNRVTRVEYTVPVSATTNLIVWYAPTILDSPTQTAYLNSLKAQFDALKPIPHKYWLCTDVNPVDGVLESLTEMSQAQKDAVDAPEVAEAARQQAFTDEITGTTGNDLCQADLSVIATKLQTAHDNLQTAITGIGNLAQAKTVLGQMNDTYWQAFGKVAKCVRSIQH